MSAGQYVRVRRRQTDPYTYYGVVGRRALRRPFKRAQEASNYSAAVQERLASLRAAAERARQTDLAGAPVEGGADLTMRPRTQKVDEK